MPNETDNHEPSYKGLAALKHAIYSLADIPDREWIYISGQIRECVYRSGDILVRTGEPMKDFFFIVSGLIRYYYTTEDGKEFNKTFASDNHFAGSFAANVALEPCRFTIQALEQTQAIAIPFQVIKEGYDRHHSWERVGRKMAERVAISKELREGEFLLDSAEKRYRRFLATYPDLAKRINQYHIASYLGITDVALSRIRKKIEFDKELQKKIDGN